MDSALENSEPALAGGAAFPPVITLGGAGITLNAVLQLLHRSGIPAYAVGAENGISRFSRWYRPVPGVSRGVKPIHLTALLSELDLEGAVLLPCSDDWLGATAALPPELARRFPASIAAPEVIEAFVDKWQFAQLLQREQLPHPRTQQINSREQLEALPETDFHGAILKPLSSAAFSSRYGVKGFLVNYRNEALRAMENVAFPILLQEFIPGPPAAGYLVEGFIDRHGTTCALFARQRLRMNPAGLGNSTFMVSVALEEVARAVSVLQFLLGAVHYRGVFSAEFKYDERDALFKLLEINARPWWYIEAPARAGIDICRMAYRDALGLEVQCVPHYRPGQYFGYLHNDIRAWREQRGKGSGPSFWEWTKSWLGVHSTPLAWDDPDPALALTFQQVADFLRSIIRHEEKSHVALREVRIRYDQHQPALNKK